MNAELAQTIIGIIFISVGIICGIAETIMSRIGRNE